jgi:hypothetical protein
MKVHGYKKYKTIKLDIFKIVLIFILRIWQFLVIFIIKANRKYGNNMTDNLFKTYTIF